MLKLTNHKEGFIKVEVPMALCTKLVMKKEYVVIAIVLSFLLPLFAANVVSYFPLVHSQPESKPLPVLLIHSIE